MAIGFMSICKDINLDLLNRCFELGPFHGLRVPHPDDVTEPGMSEAEPNVVPDEEEEEEKEEKEELDEGKNKTVLFYC